MMLWYQASYILLVIFFLGFFFSIRPTDRPTEYQEMISRLNEKKGDGLIIFIIKLDVLFEFCIV